jgi:hypothetical protein
MLAEFEKQVVQTLEEIKSLGRAVTSSQDAKIEITGGRPRYISIK